MRVLELVLLGLLVLCFCGAAVLSVVEVSVLRVRRSRVAVDAAQGDRRSALLLELLDDLPVMLNTVLLLVLLCQVGVATISGFLAQRWAGGVVVTMVSIVVSLLLFVYAEAIPKTMAVKDPQRRALRAAHGLRLVVRFCRPVVGALVKFADLQAPSGAAADDPVSEGELRLLARQSALAGSIGVADADLVDRSFFFGDQTIENVMVDRDQIVVVDQHGGIEGALAVAIDAGHRRLPVVDEGLDNVVGVVRLRDLAAAAGSSPSAEVADVMGSPLRCGPHDSIAHVMQRMRASGTWLAIACDRSGHTVGLVTVEDVVAELMGEIEEDPVVRPQR